MKVHVLLLIAKIKTKLISLDLSIKETNVKEKLSSFFFLKTSIVALDAFNSLKTQSSAKSLGHYWYAGLLWTCLCFISWYWMTEEEETFMTLHRSLFLYFRSSENCRQHWEPGKKQKTKNRQKWNRELQGGGGFLIFHCYWKLHFIKRSCLKFNEWLWLSYFSLLSIIYCKINEKKWNSEKLQEKQNRKSVCHTNNTSLVLWCLKK